MDDRAARDQLEDLMSDERLVRLCELHRTGDSIFDVIKLKEDQHSAMLAWMLDPKEGHGQGDEILRDLLVAASVAYRDSETLHDNSATARFFIEWPPSTLRVASFASAFTARELSVTGEGRFDLFVVDTQNEFVLVIENKVGTKHRRTQLEAYAKQTTAVLSKNRRLKDYKKVFIALDAYFDPYWEGPREADTHWIHLGYDWLDTPASRAQGHLERGDASARLVAAYCQAISEYEMPRTRQIERLAAELHRDYPGAVRHLIGQGVGRAEMSWLQSAAWDRDIMVFGLQNKSVIRTFRQSNAMASVRLELIEALGIEEGHVEYELRDVNVCPREAGDLMKGHEWPVYIRARSLGDRKDRFSVAIVWRERMAATLEIARALRAALAVVHTDFSKRPDATWRAVQVRESVTLPSLRRVVADFESKISSAIRGIEF